MPRRSARAELMALWGDGDLAPGLQALGAELRLGVMTQVGARDQIIAVGHRVVHGGERYSSAVRIKPEVQREIAKLAELAQEKIIQQAG